MRCYCCHINYNNRKETNFEEEFLNGVNIIILKYILKIFKILLEVLLNVALMN